MQKLKNILKSPLERLHLLSYTKTQTHLITQNYKTSGKGFLFFPLPISSETQEIGDIQISPKPSGIVFNPCFKVVVYEHLKPRTCITLSYKAVVTSVHHPFVSKERHAQNKDPHIISGEDEEIKKIVSHVIEKNMEDEKKLRALYEFALSYLTYAHPIDGLYSYKEAIEKKYVDCGGFCTFLASLYEAAGYVTELQSGFLTLNNPHNKLTMHVWLKVILPDYTSYYVDPSEDFRRRKHLTGRWGGFGYIGSDRILYSQGINFKVVYKEKNYFFDFIQNPVYT